MKKVIAAAMVIILVPGLFAEPARAGDFGVESAGVRRGEVEWGQRWCGWTVNPDYAFTLYTIEKINPAAFKYGEVTGEVRMRKMVEDKGKAASCSHIVSMYGPKGIKKKDGVIK